jgi:GT2 family glycosyltransferase
VERGRSKVSIIIPNYNGKEFLKRLLPSIANQTFDDYEVIIIDDSSPDRSVLEYIKDFVRERKNMSLIENAENLGFVKTCNKGIRLASGDYICLLTNDTELESNFLERNVEIMDADGSIGVLSCIIVDGNGDNLFSGGSFKAGLRVNLQDDFQGVRSVDWVAGTAAFYRREVFDKVGLLNEDFVMYHEDIDFCLRVKSETDYRVCMFGEKLVTHYRQVLKPAQRNLAREDRLCYYAHRNYILLLKKYCPKYIPKILLYNLQETINLLIVSALRLDRRYLLLSLHIIGGTLHGLTKRQGEKAIRWTTEGR